MSRAIVSVIQEDNGAGTNETEEKCHTTNILGSDRKTEVSDVDFDALFEHWERTLQIGTKGGNRRLELLVNSHTQILLTLFQSGILSPVDSRFDELERILVLAFEDQYYETDLLNAYRELTHAALDVGETSVIEQLLGSVLGISEKLTRYNDDDEEYFDELSGERRDVVASCFSISIECIGILGNHHEADSGILRRITSNTMNSIDTTLGATLDALESHDGDGAQSQGIEQNLLTEVFLTLSSVIGQIGDSDEVVAMNLTKALIEISLRQDRNPEQVWAQLESDSDKTTRVAQIIKKTSDRQGYSISLQNVNNSDPNELADFVDEILNESNEMITQ